METIKLVGYTMAAIFFLVFALNILKTINKFFEDE